LPRSEARILVIGAGSIGTRHARNLSRLSATVEVTDTNQARAEATGVAAVAWAAAQATLGSYDGVVIASPTSAHLSQTAIALEAGAKVLVEKPVCPTRTDADRPIIEATDRIMVGYNLRFHQPVQRFVGLVHAGRAGSVVAVRAWFGSWLPDWRPSVDYRTTYSAQLALGGGVLLDAIHELDLLVWLLGPELDVIGAVVERLGSLDIETEDTVRALLRYGKHTVVEVALDYLSRAYRRGIEVIGDEATIRLDWSDKTLTVEDASERSVETADTPIDESYEREAECFVDWLAGDAAPPVDGNVGLASVGLADRIREAAGRPPQPAPI
jgi:predicted dehydrogenase